MARSGWAWQVWLTYQSLTKGNDSMVYSWKIPIYPKVSPQKAGEHIEELEKEHGEITPKILLDDSRPKDAVLHPCYEWDDATAAEKYRLYQSKQIIGNLVTVRVDQQPLEPVRAFVSIKERNESASYVTTAKALSDEKTKAQVISNAMQELRMFEAKYRGLIDVAEIMRAFVEELKGA